MPVAGLGLRVQLNAFSAFAARFVQRFYELAHATASESAPLQTTQAEEQDKVSSTLNHLRQDWLCLLLFALLCGGLAAARLVQRCDELADVTAPESAPLQTPRAEEQEKVCLVGRALQQFGCGLGCA